MKFTVYIDEVHDLFYFKGGFGCNYHMSHPKLDAEKITSRLVTCGDQVRPVYTMVKYVACKKSMVTDILNMNDGLTISNAAISYWINQ